MNKEIAEETSLLALKVSSALDNHLRKIQENCSKEDFDFSIGKEVATWVFELITLSGLTFVFALFFD